MTPQPSAAGTLHVVATPIGNLGDITFRAVEVLRSCPVIAAEDTRRLRVLAERYAFRPRRVVRCDERTEERASSELLEALAGGEDVALTTDAGTPGVADPGYRLVRRAREAGFRVVPVPGPSAPVAALSASGLPTDRFLFAGFPPRRPGRVRAFLQPLLERAETLLVLESPERALSLLAEVDRLAPGRRVVVGRELTKIHEELLDGTAAEVRQRLAGATGGGRLRGEIVVLVEGAGRGPARAQRAGGSGASGEPARHLGPGPEAARRIARELAHRPWAAKLSRRDLADLLATACGLDRNDAYRMAQSAGVPDPEGEEPGAGPVPRTAPPEASPLPEAAPPERSRRGRG